MDLLFLGGTKFVGRHAAEAAVMRGHRVTLFHRGSLGPGIVVGASEIFGDREGVLDALQSRPWDAVIDSCGYVPRVVRNSAEALANNAGRYLFVSTISVYKETSDGGLTEPLIEKPVDTEEVNGDTYGPLKQECERVVNEIFGDRSVIVRPGIVAGPYDPTNRFTHWATRFSEGGDVLVPDLKDQSLQVIDARDLGLFMVEGVENGLSGVFDAAGEQTTFGGMIDACQSLNPAANPRWASEAFLQKQGVGLWTDLPLAISAADGTGALFRVDSSPAVDGGLRRRPLNETASDTAKWARSITPTDPPRHGISREREMEVLKWL